MRSVALGVHRLTTMQRNPQFDTAQTRSAVLPLLTTPGETFMELKHSLPSHISVVQPFIDQVMSFITRFREVDGSEDDIELALGEALLNAVIHGNAQDPYKRVYVTTRCNSDGEVSITIRDQGLGFDSRAVPDPTAPENRMSSHGRGIYLIRSLMDEVSFDEGGTVLHMRKSSPVRPL
jgi:serine/threonine-protein kinase RsbW